MTRRGQPTLLGAPSNVSLLPADRRQSASRQFAVVGTVWLEQPDAGAAVERHLGVWVTRGRLGTAQEKGLLETLYPVSPKGGGPFSVSKAQAISIPLI